MEPFSVFSYGKPMVMIHKGWKDGKEKPYSSIHSNQPKASKISVSHAETPVIFTEERGAVTQEFEFVNGTDPFRNKDPEIRKLVRAHVVKDSSRKRKLQKRGINKGRTGKGKYDDKIEARGSESESLITSENTLSPSTIGADSEIEGVACWFPLPTPGLDPHPQLSPLIYHISKVGESMWPLSDLLRFNPISPASWFDWCLTDEALFHALLYTTSTYAGLFAGTTDSKESIVHVGKSLSLINERLSRMGVEVEVETGTIGAVSCLALTESLRGNFEGWKIHMTGIKQMVDTKGGMANLDMILQLKLHRADLTGALVFLDTPFFSRLNSLPNSYCHTAPLGLPLSSSLVEIFGSLRIDVRLRESLLSLLDLSLTVSEILSAAAKISIPEQIKLLKVTYALRYEFLQPASLAYNDFDLLSLENQHINEVLRTGALLYMQATLQEFPLSALGSRGLVHKLKKLVITIQIANKSQGELVAWLLFMGGLEAKAGEDRMWFVAQLAKLLAHLKMKTWEVVELALGKLWWVKKIHQGGV